MSEAGLVLKVCLVCIVFLYGCAGLKPGNIPPSLESILSKYSYETVEEGESHKVTIRGKIKQPIEDESIKQVGFEIGILWKHVGYSLCKDDFTGVPALSMLLGSWDGITEEGERTGGSSFGLKYASGTINCGN